MTLNYDGIHRQESGQLLRHYAIEQGTTAFTDLLAHSKHYQHHRIAIEVLQEMYRI